MKKFTVLFLIFSLAGLSGNLYAKKKGVDLIVQKKDGQLVRGELIAVKENSLLLKEKESGTDVSVGVREIRAIRKIGKSEVLKWSGIGSLTGGLIGALGPLGLNITFRVTPNSEVLSISGKYALILGAAGLVAGGIFGAMAGKEEQIKIEGSCQEENERILNKLRSEARIPNYQ